MEGKLTFSRGMFIISWITFSIPHSNLNEAASRMFTHRDPYIRVLTVEETEAPLVDSITEAAKLCKWDKLTIRSELLRDNTHSQIHIRKNLLSFCFNKLEILNECDP